MASMTQHRLQYLRYPHGKKEHVRTARKAITSKKPSSPRGMHRKPSPAQLWLPYDVNYSKKLKDWYPQIEQTKNPIPESHLILAQHRNNSAVGNLVIEIICGRTVHFVRNRGPLTLGRTLPCTWYGKCTCGGARQLLVIKPQHV
jgi:hypothetical protein